MCSFLGGGLSVPVSVGSAPCCFRCSSFCLRRYAALCSIRRCFCDRVIAWPLLCCMFDVAFLIMRVSCISLYCSYSSVFITPRILCLFWSCGLSCNILIRNWDLLFIAAISPIMASMYIITRNAPISDHWGTPMLFPFGSPYLPLYLGASLVPWCPLLIWLIFSPGSPFLYCVSHSSVLLIVPNALDGPISNTLPFLSASSMYWSTFTIASTVETPSFYPYWLLLSSICVILVRFLAISLCHFR